MLQISKIALWLSVFCHVSIYGTWPTDNATYIELSTGQLKS